MNVLAGKLTILGIIFSVGTSFAQGHGGGDEFIIRGATAEKIHEYLSQLQNEPGIGLEYGKNHIISSELRAAEPYKRVLSCIVGFHDAPGVIGIKAKKDNLCHLMAFKDFSAREANEYHKMLRKKYPSPLPRAWQRGSLHIRTEVPIQSIQCEVNEDSLDSAVCKITTGKRGMR